MGLPVRPFSITVVMTGSSESGGGFHQSVTNLRMLVLSAPEHFRIQVLDVHGTFSDDIDELVSAGALNRADVLPASFELRTLNDRVVASPRWVYRVARFFLAISGTTVGMSPAARYLDNSETDLVYFLSPAPMATELQQKPFVWTFWDIAHRDSPEFPEVRTSRKFEERENYISLALTKAVLVVVDSAELVEKVRNIYGVRSEKFVTIPFAPARALASGAFDATNLPEEVRELDAPYVFYPAQLWAHKNHVRIAEALCILKEQGHDFHAVFVGKDHGAGASIRKRIEELGVGDRIHFLGYVADEAIPALYAHATALVMASYFGPTNIPPLEAFAMRTPVVASELHKAQLGKGAYYFDPDDPLDLARVILRSQEESSRVDLIKHGLKQLKDLQALTSQGETLLFDRLDRLSRRIS